MSRIEAAAKALYQHNATDNFDSSPDYPADEFVCCAKEVLAIADSFLLSDATVERAARAARSYAEDWCADFADVIALGSRFDEHMDNIARAVLSAAVDEER